VNLLARDVNEQGKIIPAPEGHRIRVAKNRQAIDSDLPEAPNAPKLEARLLAAEQVVRCADFYRHVGPRNNTGYNPST
jgi:hypothetical protein